MQSPKTGERTGSRPSAAEGGGATAPALRPTDHRSTSTTQLLCFRGGQTKVQTSGDQRREIAKSCFRRMGGAQRYPSPHAPALMGIAALHPSYGISSVLRS